MGISHHFRRYAVNIAPILGSAGAGLLTYAWHRRWETAEDGSRRRGWLDGFCHGGTAVAVALPAAPYVRNPFAFVPVALASAIAIDLDHVVIARTFEMKRCQSLGSRPSSHSILAMLAASAAIEHLYPEQHLGLAMLLGLGSHLLRDIGTGGAPLFLPRRIIEVPYQRVIPLLGVLAISSRQATRLHLGHQLSQLNLHFAPNED